MAMSRAEEHAANIMNGKYGIWSGEISNSERVEVRGELAQQRHDMEILLSSEFKLAERLLDEKNPAAIAEMKQLFKSIRRHSVTWEKLMKAGN